MDVSRLFLTLSLKVATPDGVSAVLIDQQMVQQLVYSSQHNIYIEQIILIGLKN